MTRDFANESALLVKVHPLEVRVIACKDLVGLRDNPNLGWVLTKDLYSARVVAINIPRSFHLQ